MLKKILAFSVVMLWAGVSGSATTAGRPADEKIIPKPEAKINSTRPVTSNPPQVIPAPSTQKPATQKPAATVPKIVADRPAKPEVKTTSQTPKTDSPTKATGSSTSSTTTNSTPKIDASAVRPVVPASGGSSAASPATTSTTTGVRPASSEAVKGSVVANPTSVIRATDSSKSSGGSKTPPSATPKADPSVGVRTLVPTNGESTKVSPATTTTTTGVRPASSEAVKGSIILTPKATDIVRTPKEDNTAKPATGTSSTITATPPSATTKNIPTLLKGLIDKPVREGGQTPPSEPAKTPPIKSTSDSGIQGKIIPIDNLGSTLHKTGSDTPSEGGGKKIIPIFPTPDIVRQVPSGGDTMVSPNPPPPQFTRDIPTKGDKNNPPTGDFTKGGGTTPPVRYIPSDGTQQTPPDDSKETKGNPKGRDIPSGGGTTGSPGDSKDRNPTPPNPPPLGRDTTPGGEEKKDNPKDTPGGEDKKNPTRDCKLAKPVIIKYQTTCEIKSSQSASNSNCSKELQEEYARFCGTEESETCLKKVCVEKPEQGSSCQLNEADYEVMKQMLFMDFCSKEDCDPELVKKVETIFGMNSEELQAIYAKQGVEQLEQSAIPIGVSYCKFIFKRTHCLPNFCLTCNMPEKVYAGLKFYSQNCEGKDSSACPASVAKMKQKYCDIERDENGLSQLKEKTVAQCFKDHGCFVPPPSNACIAAESQPGKPEDLADHSKDGSGGGKEDMSSNGTAPSNSSNNSSGGKSGCALAKNESAKPPFTPMALWMFGLTAFFLASCRWGAKRKKVGLFLSLGLLLLSCSGFANADDSAASSEEQPFIRSPAQKEAGSPQAPQEKAADQLSASAQQMTKFGSIKNNSDFFKSFKLPDFNKHQACEFDAEKLNFLNSYYQSFYTLSSKNNEADVIKLKDQYKQICGEEDKQKILFLLRGENEKSDAEEAATKIEKITDNKSTGLQWNQYIRKGEEREKSDLSICECLMAKHCELPDFCQEHCALSDPFERAVIDEVGKKCVTDRTQCSARVQKYYGKICQDLDPNSCLKMYHCSVPLTAEPPQCAPPPGGGLKMMPPKPSELPAGIIAQGGPEENRAIARVGEIESDVSGGSGCAKSSLTQASVNFSTTLIFWIWLLPSLGISLLRFKKR